MTFRLRVPLQNVQEAVIGFDPRRVREEAPQHAYPLGLNVLGKGLGQQRFTDARFAGNDHKAALPAFGSLQVLLEAAQFFFAPDEFWREQHGRLILRRGTDRWLSVDSVHGCG